MNGAEEKSRTEKMASDFLDTSTDSITNWGKDFINTNVPKIMDWTVTKIQETISSLVDNKKAKDEILVINQGTFFKGIKKGEQRKEIALIWAMKKTGLDEEQIKHILEISKHAYDPVE